VSSGCCGVAQLVRSAATEERQATGERDARAVHGTSWQRASRRRTAQRVAYLPQAVSLLHDVVAGLLLRACKRVGGRAGLSDAAEAWQPGGAASQRQEPRAAPILGAGGLEVAFFGVGAGRAWADCTDLGALLRDPNPRCHTAHHPWLTCDGGQQRAGCDQGQDKLLHGAARGSSRGAAMQEGDAARMPGRDE
jgi:hypothetical protein